jgi:hypothetical protein
MSRSDVEALLGQPGYDVTIEAMGGYVKPTMNERTTSAELGKGRIHPDPVRFGADNQWVTSDGFIGVTFDERDHAGYKRWEEVEIVKLTPFQRFVLQFTRRWHRWFW